MIPIVFILLSFYYFYLARKSHISTSSTKTQKLGVLLSKLTLIVPLVALGVFAVLFLTILSGHLAERSSHALILLVLWLMLTNCYAWMLSYFDKKKFLMHVSIIAICSLVGIILLTPLERYGLFIYDSIGNVSFIVGFLGLLLFYLGYYFKRPTHLLGSPSSEQ